MDSDEEEMAAMRNSSRYGGGRAPAPSSSSKPAAAPAAPTVSARAHGGSSSSRPPIAPDSDDDVAPSVSKGRQQRGPLKPGAGSTTAGAADMSVEEESSADEEPAGSMRGFLPVTFGRPGKQTSGPTKAQAMDDARRKDSKTAPEKKSGVQLGPRVMDAATRAGAASRAERSSRLAAAAEAKARAEAMEVDAAEATAPAEKSEVFGFMEAPPPPGEEDKVLPVSHEAVIPAFDKPVPAIALDPKGSRMIVGSMDGQLRFYDFNGMSEAKESFRSAEPVEGHMVQALSFSTTGGACLVITSDGFARIYDRDGSSRPIQSTVRGDMYVRDMSNTNGHTQMLTHGHWHPYASENFVTSSLDGTLRIWDMKAKPVGMDQVLPSIHVLKCLDKRGVCVGGTMGRAGGLYPACCAYAPTGTMIAGGCSDGSVQVFFEKARYMKPDKVLRSAHTELVTSVAFLGDGVGGNKLVSRSLDGTMKLWDCRMLSDAKGPLKAWDNLASSHDKMAVCASPDGKYVVTGTSFEKKGVNGNSSVRIFSTEDFSLARNLDFGQRSVVSLVWQREINQVVVGTSTGEVVMLYSPFSSKKGALHFVGRHKAVRAAHLMEDATMGPIFNMTDGKDIQKFYNTGHGNLESIRRQEVRQNQKTIVPIKPPALDGKTAVTAGTKLVSKTILELEGKSKITVDSQGERVDSQKALLKYADKPYKYADQSRDNITLDAYAKTQPVKILDYSVDESEGDKRMHTALDGDFCRKCGQKMCRCVDYTMWGDPNKKRKTN